MSIAASYDRSDSFIDLAATVIQIVSYNVKSRKVVLLSETCLDASSKDMFLLKIIVLIVSIICEYLVNDIPLLFQISCLLYHFGDEDC